MQGANKSQAADEGRTDSQNLVANRGHCTASLKKPFHVLPRSLASHKVFAVVCHSQKPVVYSSRSLGHRKVIFIGVYKALFHVFTRISYLEARESDRVGTEIFLVPIPFCHSVLWHGIHGNSRIAL